MIDFPNVDKNSKIAVAMSGGVDSSTCVALLQEAGYKNIIGMTLLLYENDDVKGIVCRDKTIKEDCQKVAQFLNIHHVFVEMKEKFMEEIINPFLQGYMNGVTVNPCIACNRDIKFGALLKEAQKLGADYLVTGHYIKWQPNAKRYGAIYKGSAKRDQSYFLSQIKPEALKYMRFPLANFTKEETRAHAQRLGLHVATKASSNDLCFAAGTSYTELVTKAYNNAKKGHIIDYNGNKLGEHDGIHNFTIGQRKGLGISGTKEPYFVINIDTVTNNVIVGPHELLAKTEIQIYDVNWLGDEDFSFSEKKILAKVRSSQVLVNATVYPQKNNQAKVIFATPVYGVAKGQICAFYQADERLLGGGYI